MAVLVDFTGMSLGEKTSELFKLREQKAELAAETTKLNKQIDYLRHLIVEDMENAGLDRVATEEGSISAKLKVYPTVTAKEDFINWCVNNGRTDMMIIRANEASFREYFEECFEYPEGLEGYEKTDLNVRRR